jgi:antitoxin (DNA-binding transcriptional repressor) of toxin-antitoxin stability system
VKRTRRPVLITRFGQPVAEVVPPPPPTPGPGWLGAMAGRVRISGDVVGPVVEPRDWAAMGR